MIQFYVVFFCEFGLLFGILFFPLYNDFLQNYLLLHGFYWVKKWMNDGWIDGCSDSDVLGEFLLEYIETVLYDCNRVCAFLRRTSGTKGRER